MMYGSRRPWQAAMVLISVMLTLQSSRPVLSEEHAAAKRPGNRPNVVLILADDQCYRDFGFMGNELVHTPHIDQLAARSARYPNGYVPMSVCRPSLATLLTGLYPHQHGIHFNHPPPGLKAMREMTAEQYQRTRSVTDDLIRSVPTLPQILAQHGYVCLQTGKHWEGSYRTAGFTHGMTQARPADRLSPITGTREQTNGEWVAHGNGDAGLIIGRETMQPIDDFIAAHAGTRPFFVWYAPFLPHVPFDAPERFRRLCDDKNIPDHLLPYYAEIARFDESVGHLLASLEQHHVLPNTLIVFASDNGFRPDKRNVQRYNARSKLSQFEDGLRTPVLICQDGRTVPGDHHQIVQTVDLVPTVLAAIGLSDHITSRMSGISLMPSAEGKRTLQDRPAFGAIYPNDAQVLRKPSQHVRGKWVRAGGFKLIVPGPAKPTLPLMLFDLKNDPAESDNLASNRQHAETIRSLQGLIQGWWPDGDDSRVTPFVP